MRKESKRRQRKGSSERRLELHHMNKNPFVRHTKEQFLVPTRGILVHWRARALSGVKLWAVHPCWGRGAQLLPLCLCPGLPEGRVQALAGETGAVCTSPETSSLQVWLHCLQMPPALSWSRNTLCSRCQQVSSLELYFCLIRTLVHEGLC